MSLTLTAVNPGAEVLGRRKVTPMRIQFDSSYLSDGESVRVTDSPISASETILGVAPMGGNAAAGGYRFHYNVDTEKAMLFRSLAGDLKELAFGGGDVKGATNLAGTEGNADQNAAPVNSVLLLAAATFTSLAGTATPSANPAFPRNIVLTILNDSGGALDLYEGTTTFLLTGTDAQGNAQTESVTLVSTSGNKSVANSKYRFIQSSKAFRTITSIAITNAPAGGLKLSVGVGTRLGLPVALETATHTDVKTFSINAAPATISATTTSAGGVDTTNNTVNVGTIADGDDLYVVYKAAAQQVASGTDVSGVIFRADFYTYS